MTLGAIVMLGAGAQSEQERLVLEAQRAATLDLIGLLQPPIILSSPDLSWFPRDVDAILEIDPPHPPFHFGTYLAHLIEKHQLERVLYFGGGSAPLLDHAIIEMMTGLLLTAGSTRTAKIPPHIVLTNNRHSSDWAGISRAEDALDIIRQVNRDNSLVWALQEKYEVRVLTSLRPAISMDLDTPTDLALVKLHPDCPPHLLSALQHPLLDEIPVQPIVDTLKREGSQVAIIGRISPQAWQGLNKVTRCWLRVFAEERGMVGSERLVRGEVRSLLGVLLKDKGAYGFFKALADISEAAIIDSRVLMADHYGDLPPAPERFASDLFLVDAISDSWLKEFTQAAKEAPIPIMLGGHTIVAGGLSALAEIIAATSA